MVQEPSSSARFSAPAFFLPSSFRPTRSPFPVPLTHFFSPPPHRLPLCERALFLFLPSFLLAFRGSPPRLHGRTQASPRRHHVLRLFSTFHSQADGNPSFFFAPRPFFFPSRRFQQNRFFRQREEREEKILIANVNNFPLTLIVSSSLIFLSILLFSVLAG